MNIKDARKGLKNVTAVRVAKWLGVPTVTLRSWESGVRTIPADMERRILGLYEALSILGPEFYAKLDSGECTIEEAVKEKKIYLIREREKRATDKITERRWALIPASVKEKCTADELAAIMEALKGEYEAGRGGNG